MKIKVADLKEGYILQKDVFGATSYPIVPAKTKLTDEHITFLKAFLIQEVEIVNIVEKSETLKKEDHSTSIRQSQDTTFRELYNKAVIEYKREFQSWQSGAAVNISKIRSFLIPLLEKALQTKDWIHEIHLYSNKNDYFYHHPIAVSMIASFLAKEMGYSKGVCLQIAMAGALSDCGMAKIREDMYQSERVLSEYEWNEIKKHPIYSYQMVKDISLLKMESKVAILQHHERLDGTGYPAGDSGSKIQPHSQLIAIADIYHAMTAERLYREKRSPYKTLQLMEEDEFGKLHIALLNKLITAITEQPVGTLVELSDGRVGTILFIKPNAKTRPLVKINNSDEIIDLEKERQLHVLRVMY